MLKKVLRWVFVTDILVLFAGLAMQFLDMSVGRKVTGIGVLILAFVLLPLFIFHRYRHKKAEDYMLDKEKINKILDNLKM